MFTCNFCLIADEDNAWFNRYGFCEECEKVRNLSKVYTMKSLSKTLETIYVRDETPIKKRVEAVKEGVSLRSHKSL